MGKRIFDPEKWERKTQFDFFMDYDDPLFGIIANVDVTALYDHCKMNDLSFFLGSLFYSNKAVNRVENFRLRIEDEKLVLYDEVHVGSTIFQDDKTFTFAYFEMTGELQNFNDKGRKIIEDQLNNKLFDSNQNRMDLIYYSVIPWISFTSIKHPWKNDAYSMIPRITFGKYFEQDGKLKMPVSVEAHHGLMDGYHVGQYFEFFQKEMDGLSLKY